MYTKYRNNNKNCKNLFIYLFYLFISLTSKLLQQQWKIEWLKEAQTTGPIEGRERLY